MWAPSVKIDRGQHVVGALTTDRGGRTVQEAASELWELVIKYHIIYLYIYGN